MHICYVDESGNDQVLDAYDAPPVLVIAGITVAEARAKTLIWSYLDIKKRFNPSLQHSRNKLTDVIRTEVKGADIRSDLRSGQRRRVRRAYGFLDQIIDLLEEHNVTLVGEVWVKEDGVGIPAQFYPTAISNLAGYFDSQLAAARSRGLLLLDARTKVKNVPSVNGITTRRFRSGGDQMPNLIEAPVFGHSDAHVVLQVADIVASAFLFPMAVTGFCRDVQGNVHRDCPEYAEVRARYGHRLRNLEYRYTDAQGQRRGGIRVLDKRNHDKSIRLYLEEAEQRHRPDEGETKPESKRQRTRRRAGVPIVK